MGHVARKGGAHLLHQLVDGCWQRHTCVLWCPLWADRCPPAPAMHHREWTAAAALSWRSRCAAVATECAAALRPHEAGRPCGKRDRCAAVANSSALQAHCRLPLHVTPRARQRVLQVLQRSIAFRLPRFKFSFKLPGPTDQQARRVGDGWTRGWVCARGSHPAGGSCWQVWGCTPRTGHGAPPARAFVAGELGQRLGLV